MTEIVTVPFHGADLLTVDTDGVPHVILRPAIESIGLDYSAQFRKLSGKSWACVATRAMQLPGDNQTRAVVTVDVRTFLMLLATIDERRVSDDVRPLLVAYQAEVADAIEQYWTKGGVINPRATEDQIDQLVRRAEARVALLRAATGLVDPAWLEAKTRHEIARGLGEEPEVDNATRPLTVGEYLADKGMTGAALRSMSSVFGKHVKRGYRAAFGEDPPKTERFVDGALRSVAGYTEQHRDLFDQAWSELTAARPPLRSVTETA